MKKRLLFIPSLLFAFAGTVFAQGEMDAYKMSQTDLIGTARSVGMGGAVGAMGGDLTAVSVNPAGIGYFSNSLIATTLNFQNVNTESVMTGNTLKEGKFKTNFNNLGFVGVFKLQNNDVVPSINFGFAFNRLKNYDRTYKSAGDNINSIATYMAGRTNRDIGTKWQVDNPNYQLDISDYENYYPFYDYDWLSVFGYNSGLIKQVAENSPEYESAVGNMLNYNNLLVKEKGYVDTYDFNFGTNIASVVSLGLTVSVTDLEYKRYTMYEEAGQNNEGFALENNLRSEGTGVQVALGVIAQPIPQLRLGLAYHSPTWYEITDHYNAYMDYNINGKKGVIDSWSDGEYIMGQNVFDYKFRSPDKLTASATAMLGSVILSADYEWTNYSNNMRLKDGDVNIQGDFIKEDFKGASAFRVGAEISFTKQFTGRVGYAWKESPIGKKVMSGETEVMTVGSDAHYVLDKDTHHITWGLGYRFSKSFFADLAFVYKTQKADMYMFDPFSGADKADLKTNAFQGLVTFGYRF